MLLVFKATSNQPKLEAVKRQIHACLFEIRLFRDDVPAILRAQAEILRHNLNYLFLSLVPMLWMLVPLLLVIAQLQFHYGYRGLRPGEDFLVKVRLKDGGSAPAGRRPRGPARARGGHPRRVDSVRARAGLAPARPGLGRLRAEAARGRQGVREDRAGVEAGAAAIAGAARAGAP